MDLKIRAWDDQEKKWIKGPIVYTNRGYFYIPGKKDKLNNQELEIVETKMGANDKTLEYFAKKFGVTRERIRQIEAKAYTKTSYDVIFSENIGSRDVNKKDIFSGDICIARGEDYKIYGEIIYEGNAFMFNYFADEIAYIEQQGSGSFCWKWNLLQEEDAWRAIDSDYLKIIGNKFENPSLLEEIQDNYIIPE